MEQPSATLRREHRTIERVLKVLSALVARHQAGGPFDAPSLARCVEFFRLFADACHHAKEEELLFPALESRGMPRDNGPIAVMLHEHAIGRRLTRAMADALDAHASSDPAAPARFNALAHEYITLLTQHIFKEDNVLFRMGDQLLTHDDQQSLCGRFCDLACRSFEGRNADQLQRIADDLERRIAAQNS